MNVKKFSSEVLTYEQFLEVDKMIDFIEILRFIIYIVAVLVLYFDKCGFGQSL